MMGKSFKIGNRKIGYNQPVFIIAELSGNHNQNFQRAKKLVKAACECGVDSIKLQTYMPDTLTINSSKTWFQIKGSSPWKGKNLYQLYQSSSTPWEWQPKLKKLAKTKKAVIISRGMATKEEISLALFTLRKYGAKKIAVLHCVSSYPASLEEMNLATIADVSKRFNVISGLSDHSLGIIAAVTSVALGAKIIEKHFTLKRSDGGPDAPFSLEPEELKELVKSIHEAEKINKKNIRCIRPGYGLAPKLLSSVLGKKSKENLKRGIPLKQNFIGK